MIDCGNRILQLSERPAIGQLSRSIGEVLVDEGLLDRARSSRAFLLLGVEASIAQALVRFGFDLIQEGVLDGCLVGHLFLATLFGEFELHFAQLDDRFVTEHEGISHQVFGQLIGEAFDHEDRFTATGDDQVQTGRGDLLHGREQHELVIDQTDANTSDRASERQRRHSQCRTTTGDRPDIGIIHAIARQDVGHHLNFVDVTFREQRTNRTVGQTGSQNFLQRWAAFPLEVSTGELARSCETLAVIASQRKEIGTWPRGAVLCSNKNSRLTKLDEDGSAGLLGPFTCRN